MVDRPTPGNKQKSAEGNCLAPVPGACTLGVFESNPDAPEGAHPERTLPGIGAFSMLPQHSFHPADTPSRRQFLEASLAAGLAATGLAGQAASTETRSPLVRKPAKRVIFVLLSGGPSQMETFDPKTGAPTGGPFGSIPTRTPGGRFCEYLPRLAAMSDRFAVVRSMTGPAPGGDHLNDLRYALTGHYQ